METPKEYHYTYYSYEEWGRGYFGSRTCKCLPEKDIKYFGSFSDKSFKPTQKIILKDDYATREEAYADEIILQQYYKVVENPHFANRSYQTSTGFSRKGMISCNKGKKMSEEQKIKLSNIAKGRKMSEEQKIKLSNIGKGRKMSEETKKKMSDSAKKRIYKNKEEWIENIKKGRAGQSSWNKGIPRTEETKQKISNTLKSKNKV
jgi:hypothetical protein